MLVFVWLKIEVVDGFFVVVDLFCCLCYVVFDYVFVDVEVVLDVEGVLCKVDGF